jgi:glycosyltransferase involved in cell wall biosynthesis
MRVALIAEQLLAPVPGGTGRYTYELGAALAALAGPADSVTGWVAARADVNAAAIPGVDGPRRLPLGRRALAGAWERGVPVAPRGADLVHAVTPLAPPRRGRPLVVTVHDTVPWTHPELLTPRGARWHRTMIDRAAADADAITVPTAAVAAELAGYVAGLARERVHVLGGGVAEIFRRPVPAPLAARVAADHPAPYLITTATMEPRKGLDVLVDALVALGERRLPLVVAGPAGWGDVDPVRLAATRGLPAGAVRVVGRVPDAELAALVAGAAAAVMPSRAEGFGLPVAEAMAAGTPMVASDVPAIAEVAGAAAILVPPGDPSALAAGIEQALGDRDRWITAGRSQAQQYTWNAVAERAWSLYRALS